MEHQITGDIAIEIAVVMTTADAKGFTQRFKVLIGAPQRRQADGLDFKNVPGLTGLLGEQLDSAFMVSSGSTTARR